MIAKLSAFPGRLTLILLLALGSACSRTTAGAEAPGGEFTYDEYARVLKTHVDEAGFVNYRALLQNRSDLDQFVARASGLDPKVFKNWSRSEQMAFWINTYNALTLKAIIDHYPVESIKDIGNLIQSVWDKLKFNVMGRTITLNEIEHGILRVEFSEPRIHMAINCASIGCPPLLNEPFTAAALEEQFDRSTIAFISNDSKFRIDRDKKRVHLSPILKWFGEDFVEKYAARLSRAKLNSKENAALNFVMSYAGETDENFLRKEKFKLKWLDYDWGLNEH